MRVSLNWLKELIDIPVGVDELADALTMLGLEIEAIERPGAGIKDVYVGRILSIEPHPDADKLVVCQTDTGRERPLQIVCGAKNMQVGDKVPTAVVGATLAEGFQIGRRKMRGVESEGMMCSARELGLGDDHTGLLILEPDALVGGDCAGLLGLDDVIFEIEVTPNRGDWASMLGVARELAARFGTTVRTPAVAFEESSPDAAALSSVTIENADLCPRYIGRVLTGVRIGPSPRWMQNRLIAAGQRPINNVVDVTNFVLMETGHPLHAFDCDLLKENRIVVRNPRPGETIRTIDGQERALSPEMLVIADGLAPVAVAGIMGGLQSEVGENTTRVFLESAYFKPASVRRTARALGMQTEASQRFQRGADPEMALYAINRAAMLMQQTAGAQVARGLLDEYPLPLPAREITLRYARAELLLGTHVSARKQRDFLVRLGFEELENTAKSLTVRVPSWRHDATLEADLIEEVARLHGYGNIETSLPVVRPSARILAPEAARLEALRESMVGQGLTEMFSWTFSCEEEVRRCGLQGSYLNMVALSNPLSEKLATMRSSLMPGLLANVSRNIRYGVPSIRAFEAGPVFVPVPGSELPRELPRLGIVLTGGQDDKHWSMPARALDFYDLKGYCESALEFLSATASFAEGGPELFAEGRCGRILVENAEVGCLGEVKASILRSYDIEQPVYLMELDLAALLARAVPAAQFEAIPGFPPSRRDLAVVVDAAVPARAIRDAAAEAGGRLLKSVDLFDVYTGKQVAEGKKSVALSLVFQSAERTLTDEDTQKSWDRIVKKLQAAFGAELR